MLESYTRLKLYFDMLRAIRMCSPESGGHDNKNNKQTLKISIFKPSYVGSSNERKETNGAGNDSAGLGQGCQTQTTTAGSC